MISDTINCTEKNKIWNKNSFAINPRSFCNLLKNKLCVFLTLSQRVSLRAEENKGMKLKPCLNQMYFWIVFWRKNPGLLPNAEGKGKDDDWKTDIPIELRR